LSRRKRRPGGTSAAPRGAEPAKRRAPSGGPAPSRGARASSRRVALDVALLIAVFAVTAAIAELAGAANLGVALGVGQVAFAIALVVVLLRE
jgi:hypothetical protein